MGRIQACTAPAVLAAALVIGLSFVPLTDDADAEGAIEWITDLDEARDQARKEGKPLLIVFR